MFVELVKSSFVEAAHRNPRGGERQQRLHGHSYRVDLVAAGEVASEIGWLIDYGDIRRVFKPLYDQLDHSVLNDLPGMDDPTVPGLRRWILELLGPNLPWLKDVRVTILGDLAFRPVMLPEDDERCLPARVRFTFEAAQRLAQLPPEHKCYSMHGHSYRVEVAAGDLERLKPALRGLYDLLDHRCLNDIPGLESATCEVICAWMWERLAKDVDDLEAIVVQETDSARCVYHGA